MNGDQGLAAKLMKARSPEHAFQTVLRTSDRVLARITDGIYRQPGSALRELVANAYDADATEVTISTDRPRFRTLRIEDNGNGMSPEIIEYVLENIGGSSKRVTVGGNLGVTSASDKDLSPGGRHLIGKIGIGLFSVSQLARTFQIVTKQSGDQYYSIIRFLLKQYSDESADEETGEHEAGIAQLWQEKADDLSSHGTTVVLDPLRQEAVNRLRSADEWDLLDKADQDTRREAPTFHIGRIQSKSADHLQEFHDGKFAQLPWRLHDDPRRAFQKLVSAIQATAAESQNNTKLEGMCDRYLRMVWDLALALPLPYVESDPLFDPPASGIEAYIRRSNKTRHLHGSESENAPLARGLGLDETRSRRTAFHVVLDDLELSRPLTFSNFPMTQRARQEPILLAELVQETFENVPSKLSGGPLEFHAYLLWGPKLVPRDRAGVLVRIHGASGTGFDEGFLRYQTRERIRLGQTSCEIFVTRGLEGALNIDRESFNYAHPHVIFLSHWLHSALTSLFTEEKRLSSEVRKDARSRKRAQSSDVLRSVVQDTWQRETDSDEEVPVVQFLAENSDASDDTGGRQSVSDRYSLGHPITRASSALQSGPFALGAELEAIFQVLASFGLLDDLDTGAKQRLANALAEILEITKNG